MNLVQIWLWVCLLHMHIEPHPIVCSTKCTGLLSMHHQLAASELHSSYNLQLAIAHSIIAWVYHSSHVNVHLDPSRGCKLRCSDIQQGPEC